MILMMMMIVMDGKLILEATKKNKASPNERKSAKKRRKVLFPRWNYDNADEEDEGGWEVDEDGNIDSEAIWNQLFGGGMNSSYVVINDW